MPRNQWNFAEFLVYLILWEFLRIGSILTKWNVNLYFHSNVKIFIIYKYSLIARFVGRKLQPYIKIYILNEKIFSFPFNCFRNMYLLTPCPDNNELNKKMSNMVKSLKCEAVLSKHLSCVNHGNYLRAIWSKFCNSVRFEMCIMVYHYNGFIRTSQNSTYS